MGECEVKHFEVSSRLLLTIERCYMNASPFPIWMKKIPMKWTKRSLKNGCLAATNTSSDLGSHSLAQFSISLNRAADSTLHCLSRVTGIGEPGALPLTPGGITATII